MQIQYMKLGDIRPYERNPRHNDDAVDGVANSIKAFGFKVPIVVDKNGIIIAGHTRYKAAKRLGMKEVPCIQADDLTPEQVKAFRLADNKVAEKADWDFEALDAELSDIDELDMTQFGFELPEDEPEVSEDEYDTEPPVQAKSHVRGSIPTWPSPPHVRRQHRTRHGAGSLRGWHGRYAPYRPSVQCGLRG